MSRTYRFNRREEDPNEETTPERNLRLYGTRIPNVKDKRAIDESNERRRIYEEAIASGKSEQEAERAVRGSGVGEIAPNIERQKYEQSLREQDPTSGAYLVKMREQNKLREKLAADIDKSVSFGEKSALRTAAGYERALTRARAAGLSEDELKARISRAEKSREPAAKETKEGTQTPIEMVGPPTTLRNQETATPRTPAATQTSVEMVGPPRPTATPSGQSQTRKEENVIVEAVQPRNITAESAKNVADVADFFADLQKGALLSDALGRAAERQAAGAAGRVAAAQSQIQRGQKALQAARNLAGGGIPKTGTPYAKAVETATEAIKSGTRALPKAKAAEELAKLTSRVTPILSGGRALTKAAVPLQVAMGVIDAGRLIASEDRRNQVAKDFEEGAKGSRYVDFSSAVSGALDPVNTLYGYGRTVADTFGAQQRAAESEAAFKTSQRRKKQIDRLLLEERPQYDLTSEQVRALSPEERQVRARYLASLRRRVTVE